MVPPEDEAVTKAKKDALAKWEMYKEADPLNMRPALLSGRHIADYVKVVGLIAPFYPVADRLKSASYEVGFGARRYFWDEDGSSRVERISRDGTFTLTPNSISFVELESELFLPRYIAMRFNLRIQHVHRGLLLGTGPLVDPGFQGNLLVPIHNLTAEPYVLRGDEGFIWVEFTRTSYEPTNEDEDEDKQLSVEQQLKKWEDRKNKLRPEAYFDKANKNLPIRSSIPVAIADATNRARRAENAANRAVRANTIFVGLGTLAIAGTVVGLFSFFESVKGNVNSAVSLATSISDKANLADGDAKSASADVKALRGEVAAGAKEAELDQLRLEVEDLKHRIEALSKAHKGKGAH